jgi:hypothetical protein
MAVVGFGLMMMGVYGVSVPERYPTNASQQSVLQYVVRIRPLVWLFLADAFPAEPMAPVQPVKSTVTGLLG